MRIDRTDKHEINQYRYLTVLEQVFGVVNLIYQFNSINIVIIKLYALSRWVIVVVKKFISILYNYNYSFNLK